MDIRNSKIFKIDTTYRGESYSINDIIDYYISRDIDIDNTKIQIHEEEINGNLHAYTIGIIDYVSSGFWITARNYATSYNRFSINYTSYDLENLALKRKRILTIDNLLDI